MARSNADAARVPLTDAQASSHAQSLAATISSIEAAEQALYEQVRVFSAASEALRAELEAFGRSLADGERLIRPPEGERELRLVSNEPSDDAGGEDSDGDPPSREEIEGFIRDHSDPGLEREPPSGLSSRTERLRLFLGGSGAGSGERRLGDIGPEGSAIDVSRRNRLAAEFGGALIGLGGTAALIGFLLLD